MFSWLQDQSNVAVASLVISAIALIVTVIGLVLALRHRRKDSDTKIQTRVRMFVRECEKRRVLWNRFADEEPKLSYEAVRDLRNEVAKLLGYLPDDALGTNELVNTQLALEEFCDLYESTMRHHVSRMKLNTGSRSLTEMIRDLRCSVVPALERICELYEIGPGKRDTDTNPFIGRVQGVLYVKPQRK